MGGALQSTGKKRSSFIRDLLRTMTPNSTSTLSAIMMVCLCPSRDLFFFEMLMRATVHGAVKKQCSAALFTLHLQERTLLAGDELCESLCGQTFKFVLPPTVQAVGARRISTRKRAESSEREDADRRPRRRARISQRDEVEDDDSDTDWGKGLVIPADRKPTARQLSHLQRETSTPAVTTPHACDIRRLNSRVGSLVRRSSTTIQLDLNLA